MAYFILIVAALGIAFLVWEIYQKKIAQPNPGTPVPSPGVAQAGKPATDPTVTTAVLGTVTEALLGGKPVSNGPVSTVSYNPVSDSSVIEKPGVFYRTPAGVKPFTMPVSTGVKYRLATSDSHDTVTITVTKPDGSIVASASANDWTEVTFVSDTTGYFNVAVDSTKQGGIEVYV